MVVPLLWETLKSLPYLSSQYLVWFLEKKLALRYLGSYEALWASSGVFSPHEASINLSITPSHSCHQCLVAFPTARQVLCPSYPYIFLSLSRSCARWSSCRFMVGCLCPRSLLATSPRGQGAESMAESFLRLVNPTETTLRETRSHESAQLYSRVQGYIGLRVVAGESSNLH